MIKQKAAGILVVLAVLGAAPALADIAAYNAAMKAGDYKAAAAETAGVWSDYDKTSPGAATVAREFGFANLVAGNYAAARDYGVFLRDQGARLPTPDDQPLTSMVLLAAAEFRLGAKNARDDLLAALTERISQPGLDNISIIAAEALYRGDWSEGAWSKIPESSAAAATLLDRGGVHLKARMYRARTAGAAAEFLRSRSARDLDAMESVREAIVADIDAATDQPSREALGRDMYEAETWLNAMVTTISSFSNQTGSNIPVGAKRHAMKEPASPIFADNASPLPICEGHIDTGNFQYPTSAEYRGMVGAVTLRLDTNDKGYVTRAEVLGSVPSDTFAEALVKASPRFHWVARDDVDTRACRLRRNNYILAVVFQIG